MAATKRITLDWSATALTVYVIVRREADDFRLNDADGDFATSPADPYLSLTEDSVIKGRYEVDESRVVWDDGLYTITAYNQAGGSPAPVSDTAIGTGKMYIVSDAETELDASVSAVKVKTDNLPDGVKKNTALANFSFLMVDSTDNKTGKTGLTVTATVSIDGAAFAASTNSATEIENGLYKIDLAAADLNGDVIVLRATATGANDRVITILTQT